MRASTALRLVCQQNKKEKKDSNAERNVRIEEKVLVDSDWLMGRESKTPPGSRVVYRRRTKQ